MKNKILTLLLAVGLVFTYTACDDQRDNHLDEYSTILYFLESGENPITIYDVGEDSKISLTVNKSGSNPVASSSVLVTLISEPLLELYNQDNGTNYVMLPNDCYVFNEEQVSLSEAKPYQQIELELKTSLINALPEVAGKYVLPLELINSNDSINAEKKHVFVVPNVLTPKVFFDAEMSDDVVFTADDVEPISFSVPVSLSEGLENKWNSTYTLEIAPSLVDAYNEKYGTSYLLLPEGAYTLNTEVEFEVGDQSKDVNVTINQKQLRFGNYILPLQLVSCSKPEFEVDVERSMHIVPITYTPPTPVEIPLTADMLSTNAQEQYEGPLSNIVDGDNTTFFHSPWSEYVYSPYGHYIDVNLGNSIDLLQLAYRTRHNNGNGAPKVIELYTSSNGADWELLTTINKGLPQAAAADYSSIVFQSDKPFSYLRIAVKESASGVMDETSSSFFSLAELMLFGQLSN